MNQKNNMGRFFLEAGRSDESQRIERFTCILQNYVSDLDINIRHIKYHNIILLSVSYRVSLSVIAVWLLSMQYHIFIYSILPSGFKFIYEIILPHGTYITFLYNVTTATGDLR